ncbi:MAG: iron-containing alcohol dehydrogenase [Treponema sp.]|jgi:alcohol dehydrogenase|nr:iron-containing alcohol dehydrogenase [Treponema sp.]
MSDTVLKLDPEILIGADTVNRAGAFCSNLGRKVFIATEQGLYENNLIERLIKVFEDAKLETILYDEIPAQATAEEAENAASLARGACCDIVVGFGGLKTQYIARLASVLAVSDLRLFDLLDGRREEGKFLPYVAIPAAGGDPFILSDYLIAVDPRDRFVKLLKCPRRLCHFLILDSGFAEPLSGNFAPTAIFDGLCTSLEAYCSTKSSFLSDAFLESAISLYAKLMNSFADNQTSDFSGALSYAGLLMGMGASVSAPGIGTALAYALNGKLPVAKSWCSTVLLPYIMEKLVAARPEKMAKVAFLMGESVEGISTSDAAHMAIDFIRRQMGQLSVPARLKDFKLSLDRLVPVAEAARNLEFVALSPWTVASEDAYDLLKQAF